MNEQNDLSKHYDFHWIVCGRGQSYSQHDAELIYQINTTIRNLGWTPLNFDMPMRILCALNRNDDLAGWLTLQFFPHTEPLYVTPAYRGSDVASQLADTMFLYLASNDVRGFMFIADNPAAEKLAQRYGMKLVDKPVYML